MVYSDHFGLMRALVYTICMKNWMSEFLTLLICMLLILANTRLVFFFFRVPDRKNSL